MASAESSTPRVTEELVATAQHPAREMLTMFVGNRAAMVASISRAATSRGWRQPRSEGLAAAEPPTEPTDCPLGRWREVRTPAR